MKSTLRFLPILGAVSVLGGLSGCANYEVNTKRGDIPGHYIRYEMQEADRAVEAARQVGKDKICPAEFKDAEAAKNNAYDVFRACHTEEGSALAKQATAKANALCPPQAAPPAPAPVPPPAPAPKPVPAPPAPAPVPLVPSANIGVTPATVTKGQTATLAWSAKNVEKCEIQPEIGAVELQGSMVVTPADNMIYTLNCFGDSRLTQSKTFVSVVVPAPVVPPPPAPAPAKLCTPTVIDIHFDTNKSDIKPQYHDELKKLADFLKEFPKATGVVEGHTDSVGDMSSNMKLSQRRADSVRNYIIKNFGIAAERFSAKGFGPNKPIADNKTAAGKSQNRRIEANFICSEK